MKQFEYIIKDKLGIHARPAGMLAKFAKGFESEIKITKGGKTANADRLIALMGLAVKHNDSVTVTVSGADEERAAAEMERYLGEIL